MFWSRKSIPAGIKLNKIQINDYEILLRIVEHYFKINVKKVLDLDFAEHTIPW